MGVKAIWNGWQRNLICMWVSQLLVNIGFAAAFSFIPLYLASEKFGFSEAALGHKASEAMVGFWTSRFTFFGMLAYAIFTPLWGMLSDRFGVKIMLYRGSFVTALIYPVMGLVGDVRTLIGLRFLTGALSGTTVAAKMLLVKTVPNDRQGFSLGVLETAIWGGAMIGDVLGGLAVHGFGFKATFFLCGALFFTSGLFVAFARDSEKSVAVAPAAAPGCQPDSRKNSAGMRWLFVPSILTMLLLFLLCGVGLRFYTPYTSMMVKALVGEEKAAFWTGIIGACAAGGGMLMGVLIGWLSDKLPEWKITTPVQLVSALMLFFASGATSLFGFGFCHAANCTVTGGLYAVFQKVISRQVERIRRGAVLGWATTMYNVGYMLSTLISGWIVTVRGLRWVYRSGALLMLALALFSALIISAVPAKNKHKRGGVMKKSLLWVLVVNVVLAAVVAAALVFVLLRDPAGGKGAEVAAGSAAAESAPPATRIVRGMGFVRGRKRAVLRNKFAGFVSKVHIYSQTVVKPGDVIIEYDDLDGRTNVEKLEHAVAEQKQTLELKKIDLELKKLDPLPSEYRKSQWKLSAAKKRLERHSHELEVYKRLYKSKSISELALREKAQEVKDAEADVSGYSDDLEKLKGGLADIYIKEAEKAVAAAAVKLRDLERELALAKEQLKYYKIVSPYNGVCITNSDTELAWNAVGTEAVEIHRIIPDEICPTGKYVYAYFDEADLPFVRENAICRFRSNQYDCDEKGFAELLPFQVKKQRYSYGDKVLHLVKFRVMKETEPLRIDSTGFVEIEVPAR